MIWIQVSMRLPEDEDEWYEIKRSLDSFLLQLKPKKHQSSLWSRTTSLTGRMPGGTIWRYHVLIAGLKEREITILKDLGYEIEERKVTKKDRRSKYRKLGR